MLSGGALTLMALEKPVKASFAFRFLSRLTIG